MPHIRLQLNCFQALKGSTMLTCHTKAPKLRGLCWALGQSKLLLQYITTVNITAHYKPEIK